MSSLSINCILIIRREKLFGSRREAGMISAPSFVQFGEIPADFSLFSLRFLFIVRGAHTTDDFKDKLSNT